eukprot:scaffold42686_cov56-Phaeocystis_antarctica.AAC.6
MVVSPGKRHGTRLIDAASSTPLGSTRATSPTVNYTLPPAQGERESEGKKRTKRHWNCEANQVRSLDLSSAVEAYAARDAEMQRECGTFSTASSFGWSARSNGRRA